MNENGEEPKNIVHFDFRAANHEEKPVESPDEDGLDAEFAKLTDSLEAPSQIDKISKLMLTVMKTREMLEYLTGLQAHATSDTIAERQKLLAGMTFDGMCSVILASDKMKWQQDPTYYGILGRYFASKKIPMREKPEAGTIGLKLVE